MASEGWGNRRPFTSTLPGYNVRLVDLDDNVEHCAGPSLRTNGSIGTASSQSDPPTNNINLSLQTQSQIRYV